MTGPRTRRLDAGLYETLDGRYRIERVAVEARSAGWADGWHLFAEGEYVQTFPTKAAALALTRKDTP